MDQLAGEDQIVSHIAVLLRAGVLASAAVLLAGGTVYLVRHGSEPVPDRRAFHPEPPEFAHPLRILREAWTGRGRALVALGLLILIATPVLRVGYSVIAFAVRRDWMYVFLALIVLAVLLTGLFLVPAAS